jgi:hypothetical protein
MDVVLSPSMRMKAAPAPPSSRGWNVICGWGDERAESVIVTCSATTIEPPALESVILTRAAPWGPAGAARVSFPGDALA